MSPKSGNTRYYNVKVSEEAKIAVETIRAHYKPDLEMQELFSIAVLEYLHAYYPGLEAEVQTISHRRQAARRGETADRQP